MSRTEQPPRTGPRVFHPAWLVAGVAFVALLGAAGSRSAPGVLVVPLEDEFGWSRGVLSSAVGVNLVLFGLTAPFAAALMDRFGLRRVTACALVLIAVGSGATVAIEAAWHLVVLWGVLIGLGTGSMALVFAATVADRWFVSRRGLVMGVLTAGSATGQLIFLPTLAGLAERFGWRAASMLIAVVALAVVPLVLRFLADHPSDRGVEPYGAPNGSDRGEVRAEVVATEAVTGRPGPVPPAGAVGHTFRVLRDAARTRAFWALAVGFAICGATTNGLIGTHFVPSAHDHGMAPTAAAGLLAVVGVFDIVGTIGSGVLTDRFDPRRLLAVYYGFRGLSLIALPSLLSAAVRPSMFVFVILYGLDWVATVPPTVALCRERFGVSGTVVFGWVFAAHQIGAAMASVGAGVVRDVSGTYTPAWLAAAGLCAVAAVVSLGVRAVSPDPAWSA